MTTIKYIIIKFIRMISIVNKLYVNSFENENNPKAIPEFQTKYEFQNEVKYISETLVLSASSIT